MPMLSSVFTEIKEGLQPCFIISNKSLRSIAEILYEGKEFYSTIYLI